MPKCALGNDATRSLQQRSTIRSITSAGIGNIGAMETEAHGRKKMADSGK